MIDLHCHIMPGVDDGSRDLKESLAMFENAVTSGVTAMILTPHYVKDSRYCLNNDAKAKITDILREALRRAKLDINIYYGNEVLLDDRLPELLKKGEVATLAGSRYLLVKLPTVTENKHVGRIFTKLKSEGIVPVIAYPERCKYIQSKPEKALEYKKYGALLQGNYLSLLGKHGYKAEKTLKKLLKNDVIDFLASDLHHSYNDYHLPEAERRVRKLLKSDEKFQALFIDNPEKVLKDKVIK